MGKLKKTPRGLHLIDSYEVGYRVRPLSGLNRLVRLQHRKRNGVLYCDNVMCIAEVVRYSNDHALTTPYTISHGSLADGVYYSAPRLNVPNEASPEELQRFIDDGTEVDFTFTPQAGRTYSFETDMFKLFDAGHRYVRGSMPEASRIARFSLTLDISAYLSDGYPQFYDAPRCEFERPSDGLNGQRPRAGAGESPGVEESPGCWRWTFDDVTGGVFRLGWELGRRDPAQAAAGADLDRLATELSVNPRMAKDLHNFVGICQYYVAGFRSLNTISGKMLAAKTALIHSLASIEETIGADVFERTRSKGLVQITPAGEAVLDWWSRFYMRWTPMLSDPEDVAARPRARSGAGKK